MSQQWRLTAAAFGPGRTFGVKFMPVSIDLSLQVVNPVELLVAQGSFIQGPMAPFHRAIAFGRMARDQPRLNTQTDPPQGQSGRVGGRIFIQKNGGSVSLDGIRQAPLTKGNAAVLLYLFCRQLDHPLLRR